MGVFKKDKSVEMSKPKSYMLHGIKIYKLPVGKYVQAMETVNDLPVLLLDDILPGINGYEDLIKRLSAMEAKAFGEIIGQVLAAAPKRFCEILSELLDIPKQRLLDPNCKDALSLDEVAEIILAFININDMSSFFTNARLISQKMGAQTSTSTGSNAG